MTPPAPAPDGPTVDGRPYADVLGGWGVVPRGLVVLLGAAAVIVATSSDGSDHEER